MAHSSRRTWTAVALGLLVLAVVAVGLLGFRRDPAADQADRADHAVRPTQAPTGPQAGTWTSILPPPLSPRWGAVGAGSANVAFVVGGSTRTPCGDRRCPDDPGRRDGALYNPIDHRWLRLPDAPVPLPPGSPAVVVGDALVVRAGPSWLLFTVANGWTRLAAPALDAGALSSIDGYRVDALDPLTGRVAVLDLTTGRWGMLPRLPAPLPVRPGLVTFEGEGGVAVVGSAPAASGLTYVDRWDGVVWEQSTYRTRGLVDPHTGDWVDLPPPPAGGVPDSVPLTAGAGRPTTSGTGYVWDPVAETWVGLGRPPSAAYGLVTDVYAGPAIYLVGGYDDYVGPREPGGLTRQAWAWTP